MKTTSGKRKIIIGFLILFICLSYSIYLYIFRPFDEGLQYPGISIGDYGYDRGFYKIDPETIIASLNRGETNVFQPELATPVGIIYDVPILWHQDEYFTIAKALHKLVWKETLDKWSLYLINFESDCSDDANGFVFGEFIYYKTVIYEKDGVHKLGQIDYVAREMGIFPQYGDVVWGGEDSYSHPILGWKSIDLKRLKIKAEDALKIAEENGGKKARLGVQNLCRIMLILSPQRGYENWEVGYIENSSGSFFFEIKIDPYTGKIE